MVSAAIGGAAALGSAIYSAVKSAQYNKQAQQLIQNQRDENRRWYDVKMNEDLTFRPDAQNIINRQREMLDERYNSSRKTNVVSGGTDAAEAMEKEAANKAMAQTMSDIASESSARKDAVEQQYRAQDAALNQQQAQTLSNQAQATAQAGAQAVNAGVNFLGNSLQSQNINTHLKAEQLRAEQAEKGVVPSIDSSRVAGKAVVQNPAGIVEKKKDY